MAGPGYRIPRLFNKYTRQMHLFCWWVKRKKPTKRGADGRELISHRKKNIERACPLCQILSEVYVATAFINPYTKRL